MDAFIMIAAGSFVAGLLILFLGDEDLKMLGGLCLLISSVIVLFLAKVDDKSKDFADCNIIIEIAPGFNKDSCDVQIVYDIEVANNKIGKITYLPPVNSTNGSWLAEIYVNNKVVCYGLAHTPDVAIKEVLVNGEKRLHETIKHLSSTRKLIKENRNPVKLTQTFE